MSSHFLNSSREREMENVISDLSLSPASSRRDATTPGAIFIRSMEVCNVSRQS